MIPTIPTAHIAATNVTQIAETMLLPGDPLRAQFIAESFLQDSERFTATRNMLGFTGLWEGKRVSVMGAGMGMPSMGIYAYELINFYGVKNLIRIGSCGTLQPTVRMLDVIIAMSASHDSGYAAQYRLPGTYAPTASFALLRRAVAAAESLGISHVVGPILSSDVFYNDDVECWQKWAKMGILAVEMEAAALYMNAARAGVQALCLLTVSDSLLTGERLDAKDRETSFRDMIRLALSIT